MRNIKYVFKAAVAACLGSVVAASAVIIAPGVGVNAAALSNGPIYYESNTGLQVVNPDGTPASKPSYLSGNVPALSIDGTRIAWVSSSASTDTIYVADANGSNVVALTTSPSNVRYSDPQFVADKSRIVFISTAGSASRILSISATAVTPTLDFSNLDTSTDIVNLQTKIKDISISSNNEIAYVGSACGGTTGIYVRSISGSGNGSLISNTCSSAGATQKTTEAVVWASSGSKLYLGLTDFGSSTKSIFEASISGTTGTLVLLGTAPNSIRSLALSPDGTKLAFLSVDLQNTGTIETMALNGSGRSTVLTTSNSGSLIGWGLPLEVSGSGSTPSSGGSDSSSSSSGSTSSGGTTSGGTSGATNNSTTVIPGVTKSDTTIYTRAPQKVAANSAVAVLTKAQTKQQTIVSNTPAVCLPTKEDIVFIDEGRCSVSILDKKSGEVLRRFRTTVVEDSVTELRIGNEVAVLAPIFFSGKSTDVDNKGLRRIRSLAPRITSAGKVLVVGHSGIALGDTPENRQLSTDRAVATVRAMKKAGAKGPFISLGVGTKDPLVSSTSGKDQARNRRVVIILVP